MDVVVLAVGLSSEAFLDQSIEKVGLGLDVADGLERHRLPEHGDSPQKALLGSGQATEDLLLHKRLQSGVEGLADAPSVNQLQHQRVAPREGVDMQELGHLQIRHGS